MGCFSGITASVSSPSVRAALETADVVTVQAAQYVQTTVVPAVVASRDYVQTNAVPALQRGWAYLRDVVYPAADAFVRDTAVPTLIRVANDVVLPAANSTAAYARHVVVPTTVAYYHHYVSGQPLPLPGTFAVPAVSSQPSDDGRLAPPRLCNMAIVYGQSTSLPRAIQRSRLLTTVLGLKRFRSVYVWPVPTNMIGAPLV